MAAAQAPPDLSKPSFARVSASTSREKPSVPASQPGTAACTDRFTPQNCIPVEGPAAGGSFGSTTTQAPVSTAEQGVAATQSAVQSLNGLALESNNPDLVMHANVSRLAHRPQGTLSRESGSDDSHRVDSNSESGTKPPSLDGKSITSGTTFALDEKESLLPDDSASVKAAIEDDDAFSIRGSFIAGSRMGSEVAARARGIQLGDISERKLAHPPVGMHVPGVLTPQSASSEQAQGVNPAALAREEMSSDALNVIYRQAPDEKLLEALASPKDRLFLLRLEKDVIDFVQDSKEPYMDLPPSNSFCRMLTHKLADYYHMTHSFESHIGSVRIFRTPFCRVPPALASMHPPSESSSSTPPPAVLPKKIMRRGQGGEAGSLSAEASKAGSEVGSDPKNKENQALSNQKLSREEREAKYKLVRERIFGSVEENPTENDEANNISRASSVSANRSITGKRGKTGKQRRDDSDSFDSRHQYTPYWGPQQQTWVPQLPPQPQFAGPQQGQFPAQSQPLCPGQMMPTYGQQSGSAAAPGVMPNMPYPAFPQPQYPPPAQQRYQSSNSPVAAYGATVHPVPPQPGWQPGFQSPQRQTSGNSSQAQVGIPYAYGQLPVNTNPNDPKSQHPIPGSYNRNHSFNPQTQSFVPGSANMAALAPQPPFTAPVSHHGSPQIGSPHLAYPTYQHAVPQPFGGGYGMVRQGSGKSIPAYHSTQYMTPPAHQAPHMPHAPPGPAQTHVHNPLPSIPPRPPLNAAQGQGQGFGHLPAYGSTANLPQRPSTGI